MPAGQSLTDLDLTWWLKRTADTAAADADVTKTTTGAAGIVIAGDGLSCDITLDAVDTATLDLGPGYHSLWCTTEDSVRPIVYGAFTLVAR